MGVCVCLILERGYLVEGSTRSRDPGFQVSVVLPIIRDIPQEAFGAHHTTKNKWLGT